MEAEFIFYSAQGDNCYHMAIFTESDTPLGDLEGLKDCACDGRYGWNLWDGDVCYEAWIGDWLIKHGERLIVVRGYDESTGR